MFALTEKLQFEKKLGTTIVAFAQATKISFKQCQKLLFKEFFFFIRAILLSV